MLPFSNMKIMSLTKYCVCTYCLLSRVSLDMLSVQANTGPKWINKTTKAFWRGRDSRRERLNLVKLSRSQPDLIDAALTNFFFFRNEEEEYGPKVKHISFFDFFKVRLVSFKKIQ